MALLVLTGEGFVGLFGSGAQCLPRLSRELRTYVGERDICELSRSDYDDDDDDDDDNDDNNDGCDATRQYWHVFSDA